MGIFYRLGMWSDTATVGDRCRKLFYFIYFVSMVLSIALGALNTDDKDDSVFLTVVAVLLGVQAYRLWIIIWGRNELLLLLHQICEYSTNDRRESIQINQKLNVFMKIVSYFLIAVVIAYFFGFVLYPITNGKHLMLNIAFPLDRNNSDVAFWMAFAFLDGAIFLAVVCFICNIIIWYLMLNISCEYKILGNQLRNMGTIRTNLKVSLAVQKQQFYKDFIMAIQTYDRING